MGLNVLGGRKVRALSKLVSQPVIWAVVYSHHDSGRTAMITTADHRHGYVDRGTGDLEWEDVGTECKQYSCRVLFAGDPKPAEAAARAERMRAGTLRPAAGQDRDIHDTHQPEPDGERRYAGGRTCLKCLMFVAFEGAAYVVSDAGAQPCEGRATPPER